MKSTCPNCGADLDTAYQASTALLSCPNCGWSIASTRYRPIVDDVETYSIILEPGNEAQPTILRAISRLAECNFLGARELIATAPAVLFTGSALDVLEKTSELEVAGVTTSISPSFPYDSSGELKSEN